MGIESTDPTGATPLHRVGLDPGDAAAWARFVELYGSRIRGWCRRRGMQEASSDDVTQEVPLRLTRTLRTSRYDSKSRVPGFLREENKRLDGP